MGDLVEVTRNVPTDEDQTEGFVNRYREAKGLPPIEGPMESFRKSMGDGVKFYRYRESRSFALTASAEVRDALLAAGATSSLTYRPAPDVREHWDVVMPAYLWSFL